MMDRLGYQARGNFTISLRIKIKRISSRLPPRVLRDEKYGSHQFKYQRLFVVSNKG